MLIKDLNVWLSDLVDQKYHEHIRIEFSTNASIWRQDIMDTLSKFHSVEILLSIDDLGPRFELQRGGSWSEIDFNVHRYASARTDKLQVKAAITINIQNILYLDKICDYFDDLGIDRLWWYLENPNYFSIDRLPAHARQSVTNKYSDHRDPELRAIARKLSKLTANHDTKDFLESMSEFDRRRSENFAKDHLEIFNLMNQKP